MKTISIVNAKGGVGKTSISIHLAEYLADLGYKTLLIDADSNGSVSNFYQDKAKITGSIADIFCPDTEQKALVNIASQIGKNLFVLPVNYDANQTLNYLNNTSDLYFKELVFSDYLKSNSAQSGNFDFVIVDTAGRTDSLVNNAYFASDYIVVPSNPDKLSLDQTYYTIRAIEQIKKQLTKMNRTGIKKTFVMLNRFEPTTTHREFVKYVESGGLTNSEYLGTLSKSVAMATCVAESKTMFQTSENHKLTKEMKSIFKKLLEQING